MKSTRRAHLGRDAVHEIDEHRSVAQPNQRLISGRAVAQVKAELDVLGHRVRQTPELPEHLAPCSRAPYREVVLEHQYFLADVVLDRQVAWRNRGKDAVERDSSSERS